MSDKPMRHQTVREVTEVLVVWLIAISLPLGVVLWSIHTAVGGVFELLHKAFEDFPF